ncbi:MAG: hypothetical protein ACI4MM_11175 [Candidatus Ventricola sp.]
MGKSFVLKDAAGRPGGYLVQGLRDICCRAGDLARRVQVVLLFEGGAQEEHEADGGQEARWPVEDRLLCGGYVCADGKLLFATGDEARRTFERAVRRPAARVEKATGSRAEPVREPAKETQKEAASTAQARVWPQRRWPPPPCWPQAEYVQGRWQEE